MFMNIIRVTYLCQIIRYLLTMFSFEKIHHHIFYVKSLQNRYFIKYLMKFIKVINFIHVKLYNY